MIRTVTLTQNRDFLRLYKRGRSKVDRALVMYYSKNKLGVNRIGITTSKKIGTAVRRNRARRVIREAYRQLEPMTKTGYDFVFVARGRTAALKSGEVYLIMKNMFAGAGALAG
jgi:ribonuclease P protein component